MNDTEFWHHSHLPIADAYQVLYGANSVSTLEPTDRELILFGVYAALGEEEKLTEHGTRALEAGAPREALVEAVLTAAISRGARILQTALPFLSSLPLSTHTHSPPNTIPALEYFTGEFKQLPLWVRELDAFAPDALVAYATLRQHILTDGAASRKTKELLTMLLNALSANTGGIRSHANGAKRMGGTRDEVYSVLLLGIPIGGIIVWINGVNALAESPGIFP